MAVSTIFPGTKLETLLLKCCSSSSSSTGSTHLSILGKNRKTLNLIHAQRGSIRCEASFDVMVNATSSSISALEQLKTSAADSKSSYYLWSLHCVPSCPFP